MSTITYTNTFADATSMDATKIMENFDDIKDVINNNIEDSNIKNAITLNVKSVTVSTKITATTITCPKITLGDNSGTYAVIIKDPSNNVILKIDSSGTMTTTRRTNLDAVGTIRLWDTSVGGAWADNSTSPGWYQCDGNNGTPNLTDKFIRGSGTSGTTGGSDDAVIVSHTHTNSLGNESVAHSHTYSTQTVSTESDSHYHSMMFHSGAPGGGTWRISAINRYSSQSPGHRTTTTSSDAGGSHTHTYSGTLTASIDDSHTHTVTIDNTSVATGRTANGTDENMPAYYTLLYIMKVS